MFWRLSKFFWYQCSINLISIPVFLDNDSSNDKLNEDDRYLKQVDDRSGELVELAKKIIRKHKLYELKQQHAVRFQQILLGYKPCYGYASMIQKYGCYCGVDNEGCEHSFDCLDDCCRYVETASYNLFWVTIVKFYSFQCLLYIYYVYL